VALLRQRLSEVTKATIVGAQSVQLLRPKGFSAFLNEEYMPHCKATHTATTYVSDESNAKLVERYFGAMPLRAITPGDVQKFIDQCVNGKSEYGAPLRPASVNRRVTFLSGVFSEAVRRGFIGQNPAKGIKSLPEHNDRLRWLTNAEEERLLLHSPAFLRPIIRFALHSGMRRGEILNLKWSDIDLDRGIIVVAHSKNHRTREIPMNSVLEEVLQAIPKFVGPKGPSPYVFVDDAGEQHDEHISHLFARVCEDAKLEGVTFHTLRHTFASRLAQLGKPLIAIKELLGHSDIQMSMRYAHLGPSNLRDAVEALAEPLSKGQVGTRKAQDKAPRQTVSQPAVAQ
jgi:integrase